MTKRKARLHSIAKHKRAGSHFKSKGHYYVVVKAKGRGKYARKSSAKAAK